MNVMQIFHRHSPEMDAWREPIQAFLRDASAVVVGVFDLRGNLLDANEGMRRFVILDAETAPDANVFLNPTFESLRARDDAEAPIFSGYLTVGDQYDISRSALVKAYKSSGQILIVGEIEVGDLCQRLNELSALNREANNLRRGAQKEKARLEEITAARKRTEARLRQAREIEALGTFAGGMAHYLNNALTPVSTCAQMLSKRFPESDTSHRIVELILNGVQNSAGIVRQVLDFSRSLALKPSRIDSATAISEALEHERAQIPSDVSVDVKIDANAGWIQADTATVDLILGHLISNAVDALGNQPRSVTVELGRYEPKGEQDDGLVSIQHIRLAVVDTGCGMDEQTRLRSLDPFFTTKEVGKGAGLGLSVVYGIVRNMGGAVRIRSDVGKGTNVEVFFPGVPEATDATKAANLRSTPRPSTAVPS